MKIKFIISLIIFGLIFSQKHEYHLIDGIDENLIITKDNKSDYFYFYTEVNNAKIVRFHLKSQKVWILNRKFFITEYDEDGYNYSEVIIAILIRKR